MGEGGGVKRKGLLWYCGLLFFGHGPVETRMPKCSQLQKKYGVKTHYFDTECKRFMWPMTCRKPRSTKHFLRNKE